MKLKCMMPVGLGQVQSVSGWSSEAGEVCDCIPSIDLLRVFSC